MTPPVSAALAVWLDHCGPRYTTPADPAAVLPPSSAAAGMASTLSPGGLGSPAPAGTTARNSLRAGTTGEARGQKAPSRLAVFAPEVV